MNREGMAVSFLLLMVLLFVHTALGQKREKTAAEFGRIIAEAKSRSLTGTFRRSMQSYHFDDDSKMPTYQVDEVFEGYGDRQRILRKTKGWDGLNVTETITVGEIEYTRRSGREWTKFVPEPKTETSIKKSPSSQSETVKASLSEPTKSKFEYFYIGEELFEGKNVDVYESSEFRRYDFGSGRVSAYTVIDRYWLGKDGRILRQTSKTIEKDEKVTLTIVWTYEIPTVLSIEAPIK